MIEIHGKYSTAKVYTDTLEPSAEGQIQAICDQPFAQGSRIRIMPDVHAGKGCAIGTTMTVTDKVVPNPLWQSGAEAPAPQPWADRCHCAPLRKKA